MINASSIDKERGAQYGDFREMANLAQRLKDHLVMPGMSDVQKESIQLICTKLARITCGNYNNIDSWADIAGYANLVVRDLEMSNPQMQETKINTIMQTGPRNAGNMVRPKEYHPE